MGHARCANIGGPVYIGGGDARIIMGADEAALVRLWREKRGEIEPEDLSGDLIVQLGTATEELNRRWYERNSGRRIGAVHRRVQHSAISWMAASLDGMVEGSGAVFVAKFMLPWSFDEPAAAAEHMAEIQHNIWVSRARSAVLSIITGGGRWIGLSIPIDPLYLSVLVAAEKKFWRCVQSGARPHLTGCAPPRPPVAVLRIVDMSASRAWSEFARVYRATHGAFLAHEQAKRELAALLPAHADQAIGHGVQAQRVAGARPRFELTRGAAAELGEQRDLGPTLVQRRSATLVSSQTAETSER